MNQFRDGAAILALFSLLVLGLLHLAVARIAAPIARLAAGFEAVGGGHYAAHVAPEGPREIAALADGFNRMTSRLKGLEDANRRLTGQMLAIQEEERAELARDLHDEMGPFLFTMRLDAEAIQTEARKLGQEAIAHRAQGLGETVGRIQSHVRDILKQLRPDGLAETGLKTAIANLSTFWQRHHEDIAIRLEVEEENFGAEIDAVIYRLVQEGLTNAVRHGGARHVVIQVARTRDTIRAMVEDDGVGLGAPSSGGLGLKGMRERLAALGGKVAITARSGGGTRLAAEIPRIERTGRMKILIVDDHAVIRAGLKQLCSDTGAVVLEADGGAAALVLQKAERPQLTILDLNMPGVSGLELLRQLLEADRGARILVFSMHGEPVYAAKALQMGARGYVSKSASPEELRLALSRIAAGLTYVEGEIAQGLAVLPIEQRQQLSERDLEILRLLGEGRSFSEIAAHLGLGYKTVANAATQIKSKLGVGRTADLIRLSVEMGIGRQVP